MSRRGPWFILLPLLLLGLWHVAVTRQWVMPGIIPAPAQVAESWQRWIFGKPGLSLSPYSGTWVANVVYSARRVFEGFVIAAGVGIPLGLFIGWNRLVARIVDPSVQLLRPVPITAWLPFSIAVFGIYDAGALFLIALGAFYPIVVNTTHGVRDTNLLLLRAARMLGAGEPTVLRKVVLPSALPMIVAGLRLAAGTALLLLVAAEMIAVESGVGFLVLHAGNIMATTKLMVGIVVLSLLGVLSHWGLGRLERALIPWRAGT